MSTFNNSFEKEIKKQIEEREIAPSRDLWSDIQDHTTVTPEKKSRMNWFLAAACMVLAISLSYVMFFNSETKTVEAASNLANQTKVLDNEIPSSSTESQNNNISDLKTTVPAVTSSKEEIQFAVHPSVQKEETKKEVLNEQSASQIIQEIANANAEQKVIAKNDSVKVQIKKKKYVDPSTLLFSVENKDAIEKTKEGSNVATIDLNKK